MLALGFVFSQFPVSPREQKKQVPHAMLKGTTTRSPRFSDCTDDPSSSTTPANSWPNVEPTRVSGTRPCKRWRSEPQMAVRVTRKTTSLGCSIFGSFFLATRTRLGPR